MCGQCNGSERKKSERAEVLPFQTLLRPQGQGYARKSARNKRTTEEMHIILKGGTNWKEDLCEVIEEAKRIAATEEEFVARLALYKVTLTRSKTEYSYLHPQKQKPIRGKRLGENYSKEVIFLFQKGVFSFLSGALVLHRQSPSSF